MLPLACQNPAGRSVLSWICPAATPALVGVQDADLDPPRGDRLQAGAVLMDLGLGPAQDRVFGQHVEGACAASTANRVP